jgi:hypothetical protein
MRPSSIAKSMKRAFASSNRSSSAETTAMPIGAL